MNAAARFDCYLEHLSEGLGHADRHAGLRGYCTGLMLPLSRKSVEPMAARMDPMHASARHQSLHHFVAKAEWSDTQMLRRVSQWVVPKLDLGQGGWWIIDDTGLPKKGRHSVGVTRQYCGMLGKQDNCQVAVSISLASNQGSLPVAWQLYLPGEGAADPERRAKAGVPEEVRPCVVPRRTATLQPMRVKALAMSLPPQAFQTITWREGTNTSLRERFAALRVRHAGGNVGKARLRPEQWLLIEWPAHEAEPSKYFLSTLPEDASIQELVSVAHQRWRIERDYQDLKQDFGLGHYEGRGWRGFHHHAALSIAAYGFLMAERLVADKSVGGKKNFIERQVPVLPEDYIPRGSPASAAPRNELDHVAAPSAGLPADCSPRTVPMLRKSKRKATLVTQ